jgi:hypothetical protein
MQDVKHKILLLLTTLTIIGQLASIVLWIINPPLGTEPSARFSLAVDYTIAIADAAIFASINSVALFLIAKRNKNGVLLLIVSLILNRIISYPLFVGGIHGIFLTTTAIVVIFAFAEYRGLSKFETAFLSLGVILDFALTATIFSASESADLGLLFYFSVLIILVGIVATKRKLR